MNEEQIIMPFRFFYRAHENPYFGKIPNQEQLDLIIPYLCQHIHYDNPMR